MYSLLELIVVSHRMHRLYCLPSSPRGRDLQSSQETWLLTFVKNSNIKDRNTNRSQLIHPHTLLCHNQDKIKCISLKYTIMQKGLQYMIRLINNWPSFWWTFRELTCHQQHMPLPPALESHPWEEALQWKVETESLVTGQSGKQSVERFFSDDGFSYSRKNVFVFWTGKTPTWLV